MDYRSTRAEARSQVGRYCNNLAKSWWFGPEDSGVYPEAVTGSADGVDTRYVEKAIKDDSLQLAKTRPGADSGSDHELLIAKIRLQLKKVGKTTRPFRYDLNQIPYDYTVELRNRFQGLDLIECLVNYGWRFVTLYRRFLYRRQGSRPSPWKRNAKKQNGCLRRPYK